MSVIKSTLSLTKCLLDVKLNGNEHAFLNIHYQPIIFRYYYQYWQIGDMSNKQILQFM